jgi:hypothetical protein
MNEQLNPLLSADKQIAEFRFFFLLSASRLILRAYRLYNLLLGDIPSKHNRQMQRIFESKPEPGCK